MAGKAKSSLDLSDLNKPMPYKWRVQNRVGSNCLCVGYVDSRQVQDRLDSVVGKENWQDDYRVINNNMYAGIGINITGDPEKPHWVWKWDCGTESNTEKEKGQASDAFKRAAVKWGVGRFLYELPLQKLSTKKHTNSKEYPSTDDGKILWTGDDLTKYINEKLASAANVSSNNGINLRNEEAESRANRYNADATASQKAYSKSVSWSPEVVDRVKKIKRGGKTGSAVLKEFIPQYNEKNETEYVNVKDFKTDKELISLLEFVSAVPPDELDP